MQAQPSSQPTGADAARAHQLEDMTPVWPAEFEELLSPWGKTRLHAGINDPQFDFDNKLTPYANYKDFLDPQKSVAILDFLESQWPVAQRHPLFTPLERETQWDLEMDYAFSPLSQKFYDLLCRSDGTTSPDLMPFFVDSGLLTMARSDSLKQFAEMLTGYELVQTERDGIYIVCYEAGGYVSAHTDVKWASSNEWEATARPLAYVDIHLTFSTDAVAHQYLVIQNGNMLDDIRGGSPVNGSLSVYRLPFWHYTTPLVAKQGREKDARRWVVMISFQIVGNNEPKLLG